MVGSIASIVGASQSLSLGAESTPEMAAMLLMLFCLVFGLMAGGGLLADFSMNKSLKSKMLARRDSLLTIAQKYNAVTKLLESQYNNEKGQMALSSIQKEALRKRYEQKYFQNKSAFEAERQSYLHSIETDTPTIRHFKTYWKWLIGLGLFTQLMACSYTVGALSPESQPSPTPLSATPLEGNLWNADNLPMPHLEDASRYVVNPDNVVSANTETLLNQWFKKLDDSLKIESVVAILNHVENDDPFRMAQDLGNKYGVGKDDRGLIIILAYGDHALHFSTGKGLEGDLTDIECKRLQEEYAVPCMKAELPDSGMLYLAEAIYNTLQKKELPQMTFFSSSADDDDSFGLIAIYLILFGGWMILIAFLLYRYKGLSGRNYLLANPFAAAAAAGASGVFLGGGGRSGGFSGGGFRGGSFGGGSFGGGGATSRW